MPCDIHAAGGCMGQRVGHAASVTDDIQARVFALEILVNLHFHIIELNFDTVQQGIVVGGTRCNFVQSVDHLDDTV